MQMQCWVRSELDPGLNLAYEEALLREGMDEEACWFWRDAPSVILGRNQIPEQEVDVRYAETQAIGVYRRQTGGGAVYHDLGVINFSFILPLDEPVRDLLNLVVENMGIKGAVSVRNDVLYKGVKIVGTAQRILGARRLFHGSILYDADMVALASVLTPNAEKLARNGVRSVAARVANVKKLAHLDDSVEVFMSLVASRLCALRNWQRVPPMVPRAELVPIVPCVLGNDGHA